MKKFVDIVEEICLKYRDRNAFSIQTASGSYRNYTYSSIYGNVKEYSARLKESGIATGDRIALIAENSPEWIITYLSITYCGCTPVIIDPSLSQSDLNSLVQRSDIRALAVSSKVMAKLDETNNTVYPMFRITEVGLVSNDDDKALRQSFPNTPDPDTEIAAIIYSSGTTSTAKGVMLTYEGVIKTAENNIVINELTCSDRLLAVIPLYHIYGFMAKLICPMLSGGSVCFIEDVNSENLSRAFMEYKPTAFCGVPRIFDMFGSKIISTVSLKGKAAEKLFNIMLDLSFSVRKHTGINLGKVLLGSVHKSFGGSVKGFMSAGSLLDEQTAKLYFGLGFNLLNNYGITETNIPIANNTYSNYTLDTCGRAFRDVQIRLRNTNEKGVGEILVKSPGIMKGYFRDKEATEAAFDECGWFCTGDTGRFDKDMNISVTGRIKENIVLDTGKKVAPDDIEKAYVSIPGISELTISGVPKSRSSYDEIHAFIVKDIHADRENSLIESDLQQISSTLPHHMRLSRIHFMDSIPKTSLQKPKRYLLRQYALQHKESQQENLFTAADMGCEAASGSYLSVICSIISGFRFVSGTIDSDSRLFEDLGFDSLSATEFCFLLEKKTGIGISSYLKANITIGEIAGLMNTANISDAVTDESISTYPLKKRPLDILTFRLLKTAFKVIYKFEIIGLENIPPDGKYLICPNHETHFDAFFILANLSESIYRRFCCLAKKEHMTNFFGRSMLKIGGGIPVDRFGNPVPALARCSEKLQEGGIVLIHPEGTRTDNGRIGPFKKGAAKLSIDTGCPIIPVRIKGGFKVYPKASALPKLFDLKNFRRYEIKIAFGEALLPDNHDNESLTSLLRDCILDL